MAGAAGKQKKCDNQNHHQQKNGNRDDYQRVIQKTLKCAGLYRRFRLGCRGTGRGCLNRSGNAVFQDSGETGGTDFRTLLA